VRCAFAALPVPLGDLAVERPTVFWRAIGGTVANALAGSWGAPDTVQVCRASS
jgi:hypothetical protein